MLSPNTLELDIMGGNLYNKSYQVIAKMACANDYRQIRSQGDMLTVSLGNENSNSTVSLMC